jgi:hypothetical protein
MGAFLDEVCRVLRPGGVFLCADLRAREYLKAWHDQLQCSRLNLVTETDITSNVLAALETNAFTYRVFRLEKPLKCPRRPTALS